MFVKVRFMGSFGDHGVDAHSEAIKLRGESGTAAALNAGGIGTLRGRYPHRKGAARRPREGENKRVKRWENGVR